MDKEKRSSCLPVSESRGYKLIFVLSMILLRFVCEVGSNIPTYIQSSVVAEFFCSKGSSYDEGLARYTIVSLICSSVYFLNMFYKPLADRIGRKTITLINVAGLLVGFLFFKNANTFLIYASGMALINMFTQNDIQMIYILETFNNDDNGKTFGLIKSVGILGLLFIPYLRENVMNNQAALWRNIFTGPVVLTLITLLSLFFFLKETKVFQAKKMVAKKTKKEETISLKTAICTVWKSKQLRLSVVAYSCYGGCAMAAYMYVESLMSTNGMDTASITKALYVYPIVYAALSLMAGWLADGIGRKWVVVPSGFITAVGFVAFILSVKHHASPYLIGLLNGLYLGSYWIMGDYISFMFIENIPTETRSTLLSGANVLMMFGSFAGVVLETTLISLIGLTKACLCVVTPMVLISAFIILFNIADTKGTDLQNIKGD